MREVAQSHTFRENWSQVQISGLFNFKTTLLSPRYRTKAPESSLTDRAPLGPLLSRQCHFPASLPCASVLFFLLPPPPRSSLPEGYLLRDGKSDDNLILQDIPAHHRGVGLEVPDSDIHWGGGAVWGWEAPEPEHPLGGGPGALSPE